MTDIKKLDNEELEKASGGIEQNLSDSNKYGVVFEKGKWVQLPQDSSCAYKLVELTDSNLIVDLWNRHRSTEMCERGYVVECTKNYSLPVKMLINFVEINKPNWVNE